MPTDSRSTAVVKEALADAAPESRSTAVVKGVFGDAAPEPRATAVVMMVWANVPSDCCNCGLNLMGIVT